MFVVVDTETTGLNRALDYLLEVGVVVTDDNLNEIASHQVQVRPLHSPSIWKKRMPPFVVDMHTKNGLIDDVMDHGKDARVAEASLRTFLRQFISAWGSDEVTPLPMTGSSVGFDRSFLVRFMPTLESEFHYRNIDVSTVKELTRAWLPDLAYPKSKEDDKAHRTVDDCRATIAELKYYRGLLWANTAMRSGVYWSWHQRAPAPWLGAKG